MCFRIWTRDWKCTCLAETPESCCDLKNIFNFFQVLHGSDAETVAKPLYLHRHIVQPNSTWIPPGTETWLEVPRVLLSETERRLSVAESDCQSDTDTWTVSTLSLVRSGITSRHCSTALPAVDDGNIGAVSYEHTSVSSLQGTVAYSKSLNPIF